MVAHHPASLPRSTIVILDISQESYWFGRLRDDWTSLLEGLCCPACGSTRLGLLARGMHTGYGKQLERRLEVIVNRGKALWPQVADLQLGGLAWVRAACAPRSAATPLLSLNHFSLEHRVNATAVPGLRSCCSDAVREEHLSDPLPRIPIPA